MEIQEAFVEWINTFDLAEDVESLTQLSDGHILWDILRDIDPTYFTSSLPEGRSNTTKWIPRYENLKFLYKTLVSYISEDRDQVLYAPRAGEGLQAVAQNASAPDFIGLFQLVLQATIYSPQKEEYILKMFSMTPASQQALKELIENTEVAEARNGRQGDGRITPSTFVADPQLEFEERMGEIMAKNELLIQENKDLKEGMRNLDDRLARLQENNCYLQQLLTNAEDRLQGGSARRDEESHTFNDLESKIKQQENDFADQERRFAQQVRITEALQKKIDNLEASLNSSAQKAQDARDDLEEVSRERDTLVKKANLVDKLKQQLQTSNSMKKENDSFRKEIEELRRDTEVSQRIRRENIGLTTTITEYKQLLPRIEEHNADLVRIRRQLELDNESLRKQYKQDQATIAQLRGEVRSSSVSSKSSRDNDNLEGEFTELTDTQLEAQERTSNIEKQNKQLESIAQEQASKIVSLQRLLNEANNRPKPLDTRRSSFTSSASVERPGSGPRFGNFTLNGTQAQPAHSLISNEANQKLRAQLDAEEIKRKKVDSKLIKTIQELELAKKNRRSLIHCYMNADEQHADHLAVSYVAMDKLEMVAQIKADNSDDLKNLQNEHDLLQERADRLESENREQKVLLSQSIGQNASFQDDLKLSQEIKDFTAAVKAGKPLDDTTKFVHQCSEMIMQGRKSIVETQKEVEQQRNRIADLEQHLENAKAHEQTRLKEEQEEQPLSPTAEIVTELTSLRTENTNLKREQRLMASAFHDLAGRLQVSSVTLQRRSEQPASWLGRQRRIVEENLGGGAGRR
ncbi:MAG: hypothetical protein LQ343_006765 [Gyalolechia ehrenbergii]|nr:MAG: hypothetical protein LQ343_006765 [Gyalolechia ehrenbergii]